MTATPPVVLSIAGSDSGGGAGIQADLKTFAARGVFGTTAVTAVTAQNTREVRTVHPVPPDVVVAQIDAVLDDLPLAATKTGMLATAPIVEAVADLAVAGHLPHLVVDPVMVASTGARLLSRDAERLYRERLLPHARVVTPNVAEAGVLVGRPIRDRAGQRAAAQMLRELGAEVAVVTGGHAVGGSDDVAVDVIASIEGITELGGERVAPPPGRRANDHGTGCSLAACIAAELALGADPVDAVATAKDYVRAALLAGSSWHLGAGHGPLDHFPDGGALRGAPVGPAEAR